MLSSYPNSIKIYYSGEPIGPDFIFFDYWIGQESLSFGDRYLYFPDWILSNKKNKFNIPFNTSKHNAIPQKFCCFINGHDTYDLSRKNKLELLNSYKLVDSTGTLYNNVDLVIKNYQDKIQFQKKYKFVLIVEASNHDNFITEKIVHAFISNCIPIYFGTEKIFNYFNAKRFIYASKLSDKELIELIKTIDNNDSLYLDIINQPILKDKEFETNKYTEFVQFISNILSKDKNDAFRRERQYYEKAITDKIRVLNKCKYSLVYIYNRIKSKFKN